MVQFKFEDGRIYKNKNALEYTLNKEKNKKEKKRKFSQDIFSKKFFFSNSKENEAILQSLNSCFDLFIFEVEQKYISICVDQKILGVLKQNIRKKKM